MFKNAVPQCLKRVEFESTTGLPVRLDKNKLCIRYGHDEVIKWKHFPSYWPFVSGIRRSLVDFPHKGQRRGTLMVFLCVLEQTAE